MIRPGKPQHNAGDVVLSGGGQAACCFESVVEKFRHRSNVTRPSRKTNHVVPVGRRPSLPCPGMMPLPVSG